VTQEPVFSEIPGGRRPSYQISDVERKMAQMTGMAEKDWTANAQQYQPDTDHILGD
jgi:hypothetical protein